MTKVEFPVLRPVRIAGADKDYYYSGSQALVQERDCTGLRAQGTGQSTVGSPQLAVHSWQSTVGSPQSTTKIG